MITTVTLNPAVDKTCRAARLLPGQVNRMESIKNIAGGKGINVTRVLRQYDYPVRALGFLGGYTGKFIEESVREIGAESCFTYVAGDTRCSMNILSDDGYVTEVLEPGPIITREELDSFLLTYQKALSDSGLIILSGSVPVGVPETFYADLITMAKEAGKNVLLDSSGVHFKEGVLARPFMIKPNIKELEMLIGKKLKDREEIINTALRITSYGISHIMISMGAKGILYVSEKEVLFAKAPKIKAVNTVACGDSVVAAFAMALMVNEDKEAALRRAVSISAANATTLESAVIPKETAEELVGKIEIERY